MVLLLHWKRATKCQPTHGHNKETEKEPGMENWPKIDLKTIFPHPGLEQMTTIARRRSQGNKRMPYLTNRLRSQLSGPENEKKLSNSPWNHGNPPLREGNDNYWSTACCDCTATLPTKRHYSRRCGRELFAVQWTFYTLRFFSPISLTFAAVLVHSLSKTYSLAAL